jgi:molybdate transport system substrate-binding protein
VEHPADAKLRFKRSTLKVLTTIAFKGVLEELSAPLKRDTGANIATTFGPSGMALEHCRSGAKFDAVIATPKVIETLVSEGFVEQNSDQPIAKSYVGVAVKAGSPHPKIKTINDFKQALLNARSVGYTNPATGAASGTHMAKVLDRLGIADAVNAKATLGKGGSVAELIMTGEIDIAVQQFSEHMLIDGVEVVGPIPDEIQSETRFSIGLYANCLERKAAIKLVDLLTATDIKPVLKRHGLFPIDED